MKLTEKRIEELERAEAKLNALEAHGVDNWDGYDDALTEYRAQNELEEKRTDLINELAEVFGECAYEPAGQGAGIGFTDDIFKNAMHILATFEVTFG